MLFSSSLYGAYYRHKLRVALEEFPFHRLLCSRNSAAERTHAATYIVARSRIVLCLVAHFSPAGFSLHCDSSVAATIDLLPDLNQIFRRIT